MFQRLKPKMFYKYGTIYREVIHTPRVEWCKLMKEGLLATENTNSHVLSDPAGEDSTPEVVHECPYTVRCLSKLLNLKQIKLLQGMLYKNCTANVNAAKSLFPRGEYK